MQYVPKVVSCVTGAKMMKQKMQDICDEPPNRSVTSCLYFGLGFCLQGIPAKGHLLAFPSWKAAISLQNVFPLYVITLHFLHIFCLNSSLIVLREQVHAKKMF